ncbi:glycosyltransferase family 2 protein [Allocoleopsis sp.]|uniref:glycosyltransferase family 2 protein n=1 Tax=Allocoleopsis sp. TaxID=3088169 RepID=UPI002FD4BA71
MQTPVVFIIFNRPYHTEQVFEVIRQAQPSKLLVIADGPRSNRPDDREKCAAARGIIDRVDWDCQVFKNYSDLNLACDPRIIDGLNWVFDTVEEAIILEDDCVPDPTFFPYCEQLLERYRHDERIMNISGQNVLFGRKRTEYSYYFSRFTLCWGWATWRRSWQYFDVSLKLWPEVRDRKFMKDILEDPYAVKVWQRTAQMLYDGRLTGWDFKWMFACWLQNGLCIISDRNLVTNIGYGAEATHIHDEKDPYIKMATEAMDFPLKHPPFIIRDLEADKLTQRTLFDYDPNILKKVQNKLKKILDF